MVWFRKVLYHILLVLLFSFLPLNTSFAGVNLENGNFYITYTDLYVSDDLSTVRTYNSKCVRNGIFGFGWGTDLETKLSVLGDYSLRIRENGCGKRVFYHLPGQEREKLARSSAEKIVNAWLKSGKILLGEKEAEIQKLSNNAELRPVSYTHLTLPTICSV